MARRGTDALTDRPVTLRAGTLLTPAQQLTPGWVTFEGSTVTGVGSGAPPPSAYTVDLRERILTPGFVDLHVHGGDGAEVNGERADDVASAVGRLAALHARHGTTSLLATTVSDDLDRLAETLRGIGRCVRDGPEAGARILGAHLEGPWIAAGQAGAQDSREIRDPEVEQVRRLVEADPGVVRLVTLAPELPGALEVTRMLTGSGVVVSVGHTEVDFEMTRAAFDAGARHVTHLFDRMPGVHHRRPGPVVAALADPRVTVELIADGVHVHPAVLRLVLQAAAGRVVAVTDAMSATGLGEGSYRLGGLDVDVRDGRAVLASSPETLAGSVLTMDGAVALLTEAGGSLSAAVTAATLTPASTIGDRLRGRLAPGAAADVAVLNPDLTCAATVVAGHAVHDPEGLLSALSA